MYIRDYLQSRHVWFEMLLHPPVPSATKLARVTHVPGQSVAKGVLIRAAGNYVLAVLPATARIDLNLLAKTLSTKAVEIASEDEVEHVFGDCERGALPPFGRLYGLTTFVDASLAGGSEIVFVGNTRHEGMRMRYRDYVAVEDPVRARFAATTSPKHRRESNRRAG
ncbi:aminoacyl-tRNA deacylase [Singulisphaera sp. PoT]|uniref:aminoacyl-tRNA deacylase n=1 Tax=Singulisphaera sp. PoT TaxID=3411797 RepID=UPI003BF6189F